ncbi:hypothetical protein AB0L04_22605 [Streptomyces glaucescens]|uniref:hypothetical protein n=1 Tax=Streptomyces glaucescens TaxID=1907 RepID=UPI00344ED4AA
MHSIAQPTTASATLPDQSIRMVLEAEIFQDPEGGPASLIATTDELACEPVTPTRLLHMVAEARAQLDAIERLANEYAATVAIPAFLSEFGFELEELDIAALTEDNPKLAAAFRGFAATMSDGTRLVVVPTGQSPTERLAAIRTLVLDQQARGQA